MARDRGLRAILASRDRALMAARIRARYFEARAVRIAARAAGAASGLAEGEELKSTFSVAPRLSDFDRPNSTPPRSNCGKRRFPGKVETGRTRIYAFQGG